MPRSLITTAVAGPIFKENNPPYFWAHSVNLEKVRILPLDLTDEQSIIVSIKNLLEMSAASRQLMKVPNQGQGWRSFSIISLANLVRIQTQDQLPSYPEENHGLFAQRK